MSLWKNRPSLLTYQWIDGTENLERYSAGGYHPVHLGEQYAEGRYEIVLKLGFGSYSTVWLAKDARDNRYVAIKIMVSAVTEVSLEDKILRHLNQSSAQSRHRGKAHVLLLFDEFHIDGPNGRHLCLVSEPAACSLFDSKDAGITHLFPVSAARSIIVQTLKGLEYIHSCGIVHADLHTKNILFRLPNLDSLSIQALFEKFGQPITTPIVRMDGSTLGSEVPKYAVESTWLGTACEDITEPQIVISDFGQAFFAGSNAVNTLQVPMLLLPPEALFAPNSLGTPADIWTLGCSIYEVLGKATFFEGVMPDQDDLVAEMVSALGLLPGPWWRCWQKRDEFFLEDGSWNPNIKRAYTPIWRSLALRIGDAGREDEPNFLTCEAEVFEKFLRSMLTYEPAKRLSASELLQSEWIVHYTEHKLDFSSLPDPYKGGQKS